MCLLLGTEEGHLNVKMQYEQIFPRLVPGTDGAGCVEVEECYDFIVRLHAGVPVTRLFVLSPHRCADGGDYFELLPQNPKFDWIYRTERDHSVRPGAPRPGEVRRLQVLGDTR